MLKENDDSKAMCKKCNNYISRGAGTDKSKWGTGNLISHLKNKH